MRGGDEPLGGDVEQDSAVGARVELVPDRVAVVERDRGPADGQRRVGQTHDRRSGRRADPEERAVAQAIEPEELDPRQQDRGLGHARARHRSRIQRRERVERADLRVELEARADRRGRQDDVHRAGGHAGQQAVVDLTVAVVVDAVEHLGVARERVPVRVVAVAFADCNAVAVAVDLRARNAADAVVVQPVADLVGGRVDVGRVVVAVTLAGRPTVAVVVEALVRDAVAVVVDPVARLRLALVDGRVGVVAVVVGGPGDAVGAPGVDRVAVEVDARDAVQDAVAVGVGLVDGDHGVAVVVGAVAELRRAGEDARDRVVAVAGAGTDVVVVDVRLVAGHRTVAVRVLAVADLGRAVEDLGVVVVAVEAVGGPARGHATLRDGDEQVALPVAVAVEEDRRLGGRRRVDVGAVVVGRQEHAVGAAQGDPVAVVVPAVVDRAVAVVVDRVARLGVAREAGRVVVVAVALADQNAVHVGVALVAGNGAVAVVVQPVADLGVAREAGRVVVVAVARTDGDAVEIVVDLLVDLRVAVVVEPVARLRLAGVDGRVGVVAVVVRGPGDAVGAPGVDRVAVEVDVRAGAVDHAVAVVVGLVARDRPVAVVVLLVADLDVAGGLRRVADVAVTRAGAHAVQVGVLLVDGQDGRLRERTPTVVDLVIAELRRAVEDGVVGVQAVGAERDPGARGRLALVGDGDGRIATPVPVGVEEQVSDQLHTGVEVVTVAVADHAAVAVRVVLAVDVRPETIGPVAVVVGPVAELDLTREADRVRVVAVALADHAAVAVRVDLAVVVHAETVGPVAVVVEAVADLDRARVDGRVGVVAVDHRLDRGAGEVPVAVVVLGVLDRHAVAVLVDVVGIADLDRAGVDVAALVGQVVAVARADQVAVAVGVELRVGQLPVAVVVERVADLLGTREGVPVLVVAVARAEEDLVAVGVDLPLEGNSVAVGVRAVADLVGGRVDVERVVVAVARARRPLVLVGVEALVDLVVAVVVDLVAGLLGVGVDVGVVVVAVLGRDVAVSVVVDIAGLFGRVVVVRRERTGAGRDRTVVRARHDEGEARKSEQESDETQDRKAHGRSPMRRQCRLGFFAPAVTVVSHGGQPLQTFL